MSAPEIILKETCPHTVLRWGSGSYYLWCERCQQYWVATQMNNDHAPNYAQGRNIEHGWRKRVEEK